MTAIRMLPAMDIHHPNDEHEAQYRKAKTRFPTDESLDQFELYTCPYDPIHQVTSKQWRAHLAKCKKNYGGNYKSCLFNASHHIAAPEWDWHIQTCSDRNIIRQDCEGSKSGWTMATKVDHNPIWQKPDTGDNWDDEIEEDPIEFQLNCQKGMPLSIIPQNIPHVVEQEELYEYDEEEYYNDSEEPVNTGEADIPLSSVITEEFIPKTPSNWNDMTKTQKKNHKRNYERQQQRMKEEGVTETDFKPVFDPTSWTEEECNAKLNAIKVAYPMGNDKQHATRVDYTSLLNIVCQKIQLNLPEYRECVPEKGGFAYKCRVFQTWYKGQSFCSAKKDAKHECAKCALLGMEIPGLDGSNQKKTKPIHPKLLAESATMREGDEVGRLMAAGVYPYQKKQTVPLRQPKTQQVPSPSRNNPSQQISNFETASGISDDLSPMERHNQIRGQQQQNQQQQHQSPSKQSWAGWSNAYSQQLPVQRQARSQSNQQDVQSSPQRIQQQWSQPPQQQCSQSQQQPTHNAPWLSSGMQNISIKSEDDFPSLGGGGNNAWKAVPKKGPTGVSSSQRARGRGRGTAMKL